MKLIPIYDDTAAVACTIGKAEVPGRIDLIERMRTNLSSVERTEFGLLLHFPRSPEVDADLHQFAIDEKRCCEFWGFAITDAADDLTLRWDGPPAAHELIDRLKDYFEGNEPLTDLAGLL